MSKILEFIKKLFTTKLGRGSLVMVVGSFLVGGVSFLFNPVMGNLLTLEEYGELVALLSLLVVLSVPSLTLNTVLIKFSASYQAQGDMEGVKSLFVEVSRKLFVFSFVLLLLSWFTKDYIAQFLQIKDSYLLLYLGVLTIVTIFFTINGAFLQGLLKFEAFTLTSFLNSFLRIIFAGVLIYLGFKVSGGLGGLILAIFASYLLSLLFLRKILKAKGGKKVDWKEILYFVGPALFSLLGLTILSTVDIILVKHFFEPIEAGLYSSAVVTGKVIIFACLPITQVIFPIVVQKFEAGRAYHSLVMLGLFITAFIGASFSLLYLLWPELVLKGFFFSRSGQYAGATSLLAVYGFFITLFSLNTLLIYLFLSLQKVKFSLAPLLVGILQGVLIWFFHQSLSQVILMNTLANLLLLILLSFYYWFNLKRVRKND